MAFAHFSIIILLLCLTYCLATDLYGVLEGQF